MQYTTEDLSPVKKKITVTVPVEECEAALSAAIAMYRTSITLDGFRKGKVPANIIEKRFHKEIFQEATTDLINVHINEIVSENKLEPVSRIDFDGGNLKRGEDFAYTITFEVMPVFDLPDYEGFEVEQEEVVIHERDIDSAVARLRRNMAEIVSVGEARLPQDEDVALLDLDAVDEHGVSIPGIKSDNFSFTLGRQESLPDFETLVRGLKPGEEGEGPVHFPADFFNSEFAGRTVTMKVRLLELKERRLPDLDDAFARRAGGHDTMEAMRDSLRQSYKNTMEKLHKSAAETRLLESLLKLADFPLPESLLERHIMLLLVDRQIRLERQGKDLDSLGKNKEELREEVRPEAEMRARTHVLLLTVAKAANLSVSDQEMDAALRRMAAEQGEEYTTVRDYYIKHNLLFELRDRLLADKGMEEIYSRAFVKMVPPRAADSEAAAASPVAVSASPEAATASPEAATASPDETAAGLAGDKE